MTPEELKAQLLAEAEAAIDRMMAKRSSSKQITLREISQLAVESGQRLQTAVLQTLVQDSANNEQGASIGQKRVCPNCGKWMSYKGKRKRQVVADSGETSVERDYYYCSQCKVGVFPPG